MRETMDSFVKDAERFDDLTMLCMEYKGADRCGALPDRPRPAVKVASCKTPCRLGRHGVQIIEKPCISGEVQGFILNDI